MKKDELNKFKDVMEKTSIRRNFIDRPLEYYKNMLDIFKEEIEILFAEINIEEYLNNLNNRKKEEEKKLDNIKDDLKTRKFANNKKANNKINEIQIIIDSLDKKINIANNMKKDGNVVLLGALMFIFHGKEVLWILKPKQVGMLGMTFVGGYPDEYCIFIDKLSLEEQEDIRKQLI